MPSFLGAPELIIILLIVVLLFGVGRLGRLGGELGRGIREFRRGMHEDESQGGEDQTKERPPEEQASGDS